MTLFGFIGVFVFFAAAFVFSASLIAIAFAVFSATAFVFSASLIAIAFAVFSATAAGFLLARRHFLSFFVVVEVVERIDVFFASFGQRELVAFDEFVDFLAEA